MAGESPFPLNWPAGWKRALHRRASSFKHGDGSRLQINQALRRLLPELERLGAREVIVSCNVRPHLYDQAGVVSDPGVAVYFLLNGDPKVLACDKWDRVADNIAAIAAHVEALRGQERWGVGSLAQAFAGYKALPAISLPPPWWEVLGLAPTASLAAIKERRRDLLGQLHPDRAGGDVARAAEVNAAADEGEREREHHAAGVGR